VGARRPGPAGSRDASAPRPSAAGTPAPATGDPRREQVEIVEHDGQALELRADEAAPIDTAIVALVKQRIEQCPRRGAVELRRRVLGKPSDRAREHRSAQRQFRGESPQQRGAVHSRHQFRPHSVDGRPTRMSRASASSTKRLFPEPGAPLTAMMRAVERGSSVAASMNWAICSPRPTKRETSRPDTASPPLVAPRRRTMRCFRGSVLGPELTLGIVGWMLLPTPSDAYRPAVMETSPGRLGSTPLSAAQPSEKLRKPVPNTALRADSRTNWEFLHTGQHQRVAGVKRRPPPPNAPNPTGRP
jgi:hypothetical protein